MNSPQTFSAETVMWYNSPPKRRMNPVSICNLLSNKRHHWWSYVVGIMFPVRLGAGLLCLASGMMHHSLLTTPSWIIIEDEWYYPSHWEAQAEVQPTPRAFNKGISTKCASWSHDALGIDAYVLYWTRCLNGCVKRTILTPRQSVKEPCKCYVQYCHRKYMTVSTCSGSLQNTTQSLAYNITPRSWPGSR